MTLIRVVNRIAGFGMAYLGLRMSTDLHMRLSTVGVILMMFGLCTIPSRLTGGALAGRLGGRATIVVGLAACSAAQFLIGLASSRAIAVCGVVLLGLSYEIIEPATQSVIADGVRSGRRASAFGFLWSSMSLAAIASGVLAAVLLPHGVKTLFVVDAASSAVAALMAWLLLPADRPHPTDRTSLRAAVSPALMRWTALGAVSATLVMVIVFMLPLAVAHDRLRLSVVGLAQAVAAVSALMAQRVLRHVETRISTKWLLVIGHAGLAWAMLAWAGGSAGTYLLGAVLEGAAGTIIVGTFQAGAAELAPSGGTAAVMAVFGLCWGVATTVAPPIGATLLLHGTPVLWASVALVAATLSLALARRSSR